MDGVVVPDVGGRALTLGTIGIAGSGDDRHGHGDHPRRGGGGDDRRPRSRTPSAPARPTSGSRHPTGSRSQLVIAVKGRFVVSDAGDLLVRITNGPAAGQTITVLRGGEDIPLRLTDGDGDARTGTSSSPATSP